MGRLDSKIQKEYDMLFDAVSVMSSVPEHAKKLTESFRDGLWRDYYYNILSQLPPECIKGKTVVDFGCKYGHMFPLLNVMGAESIIGIEVQDDHLDFARKMLSGRYKNVSFYNPDHSIFMPLPPESVDTVIINEVISHVNPMYLENIFSEIGRCLRKGGTLLISDGNNLAAPGYYERSLKPLYMSWEKGPDGVKTDRDVVGRCYENQRFDIIKARYPELNEDKARYLAQNTSGLWGSYLADVIDDFVKNNYLVLRPYREGVCPVCPVESGFVMERGFYPESIILSLRNYGFEARENILRPFLKKNIFSEALKFLLRISHYYMHYFFRFNFMNKENFQIIALKK